MLPHESVKAWFQYLGERGEYPYFSVIEQLHDSPVPLEHEFFHGDMDGIGGILKLMDEREKIPLIFPILPERKDPPAWVYGYNFVRYLLRLPFYSQAWNLPPTDWKLTPGKMEKPLSRAYHVLSEAETKLIWDKAYFHRIGRNAFFLYHLDKTLAALHKPSSNWKRYWLIPVSLRTSFDKSIEGNFTGFIDAKITQKTNMKSLSEEMKASLMRGEAYGGYTGITIGRFIGPLLLKFLVATNDYMQVRTGVFTNLGNWETKDKKTMEADWFGFPPVIKSQPVGAMIGSLNGRQSLALQFHPKLSRSPDFANECLIQWKKSLLS